MLLEKERKENEEVKENPRKTKARVLEEDKD